MAVSSQLSQRVSGIRLRLWRLLLQAFGLVVLFTTVLLLVLVVAVVVLISQDTDAIRPTQVDLLQAYYAGRDSWEGVDQLVTFPELPRPFDSTNIRWQDVVLLDESGVVVFDHGDFQTEQVGQSYSPNSTDILFPLSIDGQEIGTMIVDRDLQALNPLQVSTSFLAWTAFLSFFPAVLTVIIALLLARRVITPLSDIMGAAGAVAAGDFSARVDVHGPSDLRDLNESFNQMASAIERSVRERRDMLADIAHELRTPLTVIRGRLEGIVEGIYPSTEAQITPVLEEVYLLERLVEDLRLLTLAETRQLHLDLLPVHLADVAERSAHLLEAEALEKDIKITLHLDSTLPPVMADPQRVGQVVNNLLSNALRYVPAQGVVTITTQRTPGGVELRISDNGPGVPEAELPRIFDRFWRSDKSRTRSAGGAGLGLAIARQLTEAQGGTIYAANQPGSGLSVSFTLPEVSAR